MANNVNTDVKVEETTEAIQEHEVEQTLDSAAEVADDVNADVELEEEKPLKFTSERERLAHEMLERQRQERNHDIEVDLGLYHHPEYKKVDDENNSEKEEISENNIDEQDETITDEIDEEEEDNTSSVTEDDKNKPESLADNVDLNKVDDLQFNKPGVYGDHVILKVDGKLERIPIDKALSILQKTEAADKRLENIVLRERQVSFREDQLKAHPQPSEPEPKPQPDVVENADIEKRARIIVQSVEDGEQDKAVESLVALVRDTVGRQPVQAEPTLTPDQITSLVAKEAKALEANSVESHLRAGGNYDDIFSDQVAYGLAISNVKNLVSRGYQGSSEQMMVEAMEQVRDWKSGLSRELRLEAQATATEKPKPKPKAKTNLEISESQRLEKKRESPKAVKSSTTIKRPVSIPEPELSEIEKRNELINQMRTARNQA